MCLPNRAAPTAGGEAPCPAAYVRRPGRSTTLAHELGHLIMHKTPSAEMEKEAYDFAGAFLMPRRDIAPFFRVKSVGIPHPCPAKTILESSNASNRDEGFSYWRDYCSSKEVAIHQL